MDIQRIAIEKLNPAPYNPRKDLKPGDPEYEKLKRSIDRWDMVEPLVWNEKTGHLVGGHQRLKILKARGDTETEVSVVSLTADDEAALNIALNNIEGAWDLTKLSEVLTGLDANGYDLTLTGFDIQELEDLLTNVGPDPDENIPEPPANPESKLGEVYELGPHRLMCGDSTNAEHVATLLGGVKPHLMVTDPPYGVEYDPAWREEIQHAPNRAMGKVSNDNRHDWREAWALFPGMVAYVWHAPTFQPSVQGSLEASGFDVRSQIVWNKGGGYAVSRGHYHWQHESCCYAVQKGGKGHWQGDRKQTTVWDIQQTRNETGHGTQKPIECMKRPILNNSSPGQAVYDPFVGSGTTLIAAEMTKRICYAMEIDPGYCDVVRQRYKEFTDG